MIEPYRDTTLPVADRVEDLLHRLTLREKVGQLNQRLLGWETWTRGPTGFALTPTLDQEIEQWGGIGALYGLQRADAWSGRDWATGVRPEEAAELVALVQARVVTGSRFGLPALLVEEAPHGHQALGSRLLPTNLGAAAAWQPALVEEAAAHTAEELRGRGVHLALASGLDLLRDPRWGRAEECFGEDPYLAAECTAALVRGLQSAPGLGVVLKHFAGQGAAIGGRNGSGAPIGRHELTELHLPPARAGIAAGAVGVMAAYNDIDGTPCCANEWLLTEVLRGQWGFHGIVMGDMFAVDRLQRAALSPAAAGALALRAGVDLSMCDVSFAALETAVVDGLIAESFVDRACRRVLGLKLRLGLLDPPAPWPAFPPPAPATELVRSSLVLLHNRVLPLPAVPERVAVIGPNAADLDALLGDYVPPQQSGTTVLDAVRELVGTAVHERGCDHTTAIEGGLERAAAATTDADLVVLVLGSTGERGYNDDFQNNGAAQLGGADVLGTRPVATTGEGFDAAEVALPAAQRDLAAVVARAVAGTGTPVVTVIVSGRPHGVGAVVSAADALLYAWYPGPDGAREIAAVILSGVEPVGRLPVSLAGSSGVLPVAYNERVETTLHYVDTGAAAEFWFGFGLGYTDWELGPAATTIHRGLSARLTNTGPRAGTQVVQLYARPLVPGRVPRRAILLGFTRIALEAGGSATVAVDAAPGALDLPSGTPVDLWLSITGASPTSDTVRSLW